MDLLNLTLTITTIGNSESLCLHKSTLESIWTRPSENDMPDFIWGVSQSDYMESFADFTALKAFCIYVRKSVQVDEHGWPSQKLDDLPSSLEVLLLAINEAGNESHLQKSGGLGPVGQLD
ncbi:hypothetical protein N7532_010504 [Penicillium argentinense]|uniref:Uncharacterized protein n=1 Tax=Penicillium argentinense TaxID=1131581 RepID=A0A9W9EPQ4_9EURO|nr:uncharacterized protein N7532_010504 [Penicillium argentinense]KAJ5085733.1 hypothetical protein N7532_010504 [Penicillium argentinense]